MGSQEREARGKTEAGTPGTPGEPHAPGGRDEPALSWLVVSHDSAADLRALLPGLTDALAALAAGPARLQSELIIADNASGDGSGALARALAPAATVLELTANAGYGAALNRAAALARGRWLACSNADLLVGRADLAALPAVLATAPPDAGLLGPALRDAAGRWQPSAGRFPTLRRLLLRLPRPATLRPYLSRAEHRAGPVDWVTGACLFVRTDVWRALGGFDEGYFLHYEEVDLAARARRRGWRTHYAPSVSVAHVHPHAGGPRGGPVEAHVRAGRERWFARHRPAAERRLLALLARAEPLVRGGARREGVRREPDGRA
jgi:N-acetylglucosaminyl-diphospho-decaprenol L-rhamnosyltransferase